MEKLENRSMPSVTPFTVEPPHTPETVMEAEVGKPDAEHTVQAVHADTRTSVEDTLHASPTVDAHSADAIFAEIDGHDAEEHEEEHGDSGHEDHEIDGPSIEVEVHETKLVVKFGNMPKAKVVFENHEDEVIHLHHVEDEGEVHLPLPEEHGEYELRFEHHGEEGSPIELKVKVIATMKIKVHADGVELGELEREKEHEHEEHEEHEEHPHEEHKHAHHEHHEEHAHTHLHEEHYHSHASHEHGSHGHNHEHRHHHAHEHHEHEEGHEEGEHKDEKGHEEKGENVKPLKDFPRDDGPEETPPMEEKLPTSESMPATATPASTVQQTEKKLVEVSQEQPQAKEAGVTTSIDTTTLIGGAAAATVLARMRNRIKRFFSSSPLPTTVEDLDAQ